MSFYFFLLQFFFSLFFINRAATVCRGGGDARSLVQSISSDYIACNMRRLRSVCVACTPSIIRAQEPPTVKIKVDATIWFICFCVVVSIVAVVASEWLICFRGTYANCLCCGCIFRVIRNYCLIYLYGVRFGGLSCVIV